MLKASSSHYFTADIKPGRGDYTLDMTDMSRFPDNHFDYIIANHVLEHIKNEEKAFSEIKRVLKSDGKFIFSFPVCMDMPTLEDDSVITDEERLKVYGQSDHVRLYGTDFKGRIEKYGFALTVYSPYREFSDIEVAKYGFIKDDILIVGKPV